MWSYIGKTVSLTKLRSVIAQRAWDFDISNAPTGRTVEWLEQESYAMMERTNVCRKRVTSRYVYS